jgi:hypothetical protein
MNDQRTAVQTIGRYQVLGELGRGAMGVVYRGFDPVIRRTVALKTMFFAAGDAESLALRQRLYREAAAAGTLVHPNIVTVYDIVEDGSTTAVAMELVEGETLAALLGRTGALPFDDAIGILEQVCAALDYAGSKGIVHRDIKPANILLTPDGHAKIMDFGIARMAIAGVTQTSTIMGSPSYMSPEQVRGLPLDPRSDLFSAAVVFYEMLAGQRPFVGDDVATTMYRIVNGAPRSIEQFVPALQPDLSRVIDWALSKNPPDRPQTGRALVDALRRLAGYAGREAHGPEIAPPADASAARRSPLLLAGVIGSALLFVATVVAIIVIGSGGSAPPPTGGGGAGSGSPAAVTATAGEPATRAPAVQQQPAVNGGASPSRSAVQTASLRPDAGVRDASAPPSGTTERSRAADAAGHALADHPAGIARPAAAAIPDSRPAPASASGRSPTVVTTPIAPPPPPTTGSGAPLPKASAASTTAVPSVPPAPPAAAPAMVVTPTGGSRSTTPAVPAAAPSAAPAPAGPAEATVQVEFEGAPYSVTLFAGETRLGRVETANGSVTVEPGSLRLRAVNDTLFLDTLLPSIALRAGERRTIVVPGLCSAAFGMKGEDYAGVRLLVDGRPIPGPYPAQIARIVAGTHRVAYRWASGPAAGREVSDMITLTAGGHFLVRAAPDNDRLVVQQLR